MCNRLCLVLLFVSRQVILVNMQPAEWTVSNTGPGKVTLTSNQIRLLREAPHEYQLQVGV